MKDEKIIQVSVEKLQPDPYQPRATFEEKKIREMAQSILTEGIINPIEITRDLIIVTGETRWRAARMAGLETVPCTFFQPEKDEERGRSEEMTLLRRRGIENIQNNTMTPFEDAVWCAKMLGILPIEFTLRELDDIVENPKLKSGEEIVASVGELLSKTVNQVDSLGGRGNEGGMRRLGREIGKTGEWVSQHIKLLFENPQVVSYLMQKGAKYSLIREAEKAKVEAPIKERLKEKITNGTVKDRETVNVLVEALEKHPELTDKLLSEDYNESRSTLNQLRIHKITDPSLASQLVGGSKVLERIEELIGVIKSVGIDNLLDSDVDRMQNAVDEAIQLLNSLKRALIIEGETISEEPKRLPN